MRKIVLISARGVGRTSRPIQVRHKLSDGCGKRGWIRAGAFKLCTHHGTSPTESESSATIRPKSAFTDSVYIMAETIFGTTLTLSTGRIIPTRWVGEQHVKEDLGFIPSFADWVKTIRPEPWMGRTARIEALVDPYFASPVVEVS